MSVLNLLRLRKYDEILSLIDKNQWTGHLDNQLIQELFRHDVYIVVQKVLSSMLVQIFYVPRTDVWAVRPTYDDFFVKRISNYLKVRDSPFSWLNLYNVMNHCQDVWWCRSHMESNANSLTCILGHCDVKSMQSILSHFITMTSPNFRSVYDEVTNRTFNINMRDRIKTIVNRHDYSIVLKECGRNLYYYVFGNQALKTSVRDVINRYMNGIGLLLHQPNQRVYRMLSFLMLT